MKYAIFGDIHANLEAFEAVLADAAEMECTDHVCVGDIVGYAADPNQCLAMVREMDCPVVKGNPSRAGACQPLFDRTVGYVRLRILQRFRGRDCVTICYEALGVGRPQASDRRCSSSSGPYLGVGGGHASQRPRMV